ncbi:hypothetical protein N7457_008481 [Penicillium paradoxum]|uniref:uncharacterized protein n=1 Tax=Penicillium paradoxum TaxID=176176 RepID=UPI002548BEC6|nr:uncharacterized protein N7457_008481 [Penicillium paradoxum]KAJ5773585.1 hypothetical protein N7457_008481 [Penicillium paradoxum]
MLKPFQIRDLRVSQEQAEQPEQPADPRSTYSGVVQISAADYDDLASNHPRARLTYVDEEDDDETITVGSALELSQRLEEPIDTTITQLGSAQLPCDDTPMHIFDIRRSNSVTELWKRFESKHTEQKGNNVEAIPKAVVHDEVPAVNTSTAPLASEDEPTPLMEAFEAELANILHAVKSSENKAPEPDLPPTAEPSASTNSNRATHPVEVLAAQVLGQIINGATMVQSEWRSKLPELQRQLQNAQRQFEAAQRSLPVNVEASLRTLLTTIEAHLRTAFNNLPDGGRQMAEDAFQAGRPVAENAADGLRLMASELNEVGKTLYAAFESEFGRAGSTASASNSTAGPSNSGASVPVFDANMGNQSATPVPTYQTSETHPSSTPTNEKSTSSQPRPSRVPPLGQFMPTGPNYWTPPSWRPPVWNPFQNYNAPSPPHPRFPPAPMPSFTQWPQWPPAPTPPPAPPAQPKSEAPKKDSATKSLFIGNVGFKVTDKMIQDVFASKGFLVTVDLPLDTASGRHAGFGYVYFPSEYPAFAAMEALQGAIIDGHSINLEPMDHPPIESVHSQRLLNNKPVQKSQSQAEPNNASPHGKSTIRRKSVSFVDSTQNVDTQTQIDPSALLDSPSDDPAFSAQFPSLLPDTTAQHNGSLSDRDIPSNSNTDEATGMFRFPPVSQREAQLLANQQEHHAAKSTTSVLNHQSPTTPERRERHSTHSLSLQPTSEASLASLPLSAELPSAVVHQSGGKRAANHETTGFKPHRSNHRHAAGTARHNPLRHSASMRHLGHKSHGTPETDTWGRLSRRERSAPSFNQQIPGSFPAEDTMQATVPSSVDHRSDDATIEQCVSTLVDLGYGTEQEGGRSRMSVYAAAANGVLMDAIDMIEEERRVYERRASQ